MDCRRSAFVLVCLGLVLVSGSALAQTKPAGKTHLNGKVTSMVSLGAAADAGETGTFTEILPDGTIAPSPFVLPEGSVLVVLDIQCNANFGSSGTLLIELRAGTTTRYFCRYDTAIQGIQKDVNFSNGIVFSVAPNINNNSTNDIGGGINLYGYVAKAK
jgi:hypothetical protein